ncbi:MAG TPA: peptidase M50, partial [Phycisphaerae bacterium]|nr:peptidase M50 [Phycisphaerae bacterium]
MAQVRPTFHESWYRIAQLRPRVRVTVQIQKQYYRGVGWYIIRDPANNDHFRLSESGYAFIALLDGYRTIEQAWKICLEKLGDDAPTQGEVLQLLGQLYMSNLLCGDMPPDCESLFARYKKRKLREIGATLGNILFLRLPLFDPDRFLEGFEKVFGWIFSWFGFALWAVLVVMGLAAVAGRWSDLVSQAGNVLAPSNLVFMYLCFVVIKAIHELGHGLACKKFGRLEGDTGEVHTIGIMLLVFTPMPYVDATSSWSFRDKRRRIMVAAGGMYVEIAVAAVAAMLWAASASGSILHALSYNTMFIASVSTLLFNINPLLRYDGYYILSDILEIPNLYDRSKRYLYYLIRRYVWGIDSIINPAHTRGERIWFLPYAVASCIYRVIIFAGILLFIADKLFF